MSTSGLNHYVVTFNCQKAELTDVLKLSSAMVAAGFSTTHGDSQGHHTELGTNSFGIISPLAIEDIKQQAQGISEMILKNNADVEVQTFEQFSQQQQQ